MIPDWRALPIREAVNSLLALAIGWAIWVFSAPLAEVFRLDDFELIFRGACVVIGLSLLEVVLARLLPGSHP
jgi:hypothetical protein